MIDMPHLIVSLLDSSLWFVYSIQCWTPLMTPLVASLAGATPALESKRSFALLLVSVNLHRARRDLHSYCSVFSSLWPVTARLDITAYFWHIRQVKRIRTSPCSGPKNWLVVWDFFLFSHISWEFHIISSSQLLLTHIVQRDWLNIRNIFPQHFSPFAHCCLLAHGVHSDNFDPPGVQIEAKSLRKRTVTLPPGEKKDVSESKAHHDLKWSTTLGYALNGNHWFFYEDGVWFMIFSYFF